MNGFISSAQDRSLWKRYFQFHMKLGNGFWSGGLVVRPYGIVNFGAPGDWGDLLWTLDNTSTWTIDEIIDDVENLSQRNLSKPGFYINHTYDELLSDALQKRLAERNYIQKYGVRWLTLDMLPAQLPNIPENMTIGDAQDSTSFLTVIHEAFPDEAMDDFYHRNIPNPKSVVNVRMLLLQETVSGKPVAVGGMAWENEFGYLFCLGVRNDFRRQGLGRFMVEWRLHELAKQGVKHVITAVLDDNSESFALQIQKGYRQFAQATCWLKPTEQHSSE